MDYTICCHGTDNDSKSSHGGGGQYHVTQKIYDGLNVPLNQKLLLEGAGSMELRENDDQFDVGEHGMLGVTFGKGVGHNTKRAVEWVSSKGAIATGVNLVGFSRGAVTCFKIANKLHAEVPQAKVRIFAIDPVPGRLGIWNNHCYKAIKLMPNVDACMVIYSEHERRESFRPVIVRGDQTDWFYEDTMPGNHGGIVNVLNMTSDSTVAAILVMMQAVKFMASKCDLIIDDPALETADNVLDLYGRVMMNLHIYRDMGTTNKGWGPEGMPISALFAVSEGDRNMQTKKSSHGIGPTMEKNTYKVISMESRYKHLQNGPRRFFCNRDHKELFDIEYPYLGFMMSALEVTGWKFLEDHAQLKKFDTALKPFMDRFRNTHAGTHIKAYLLGLS